MTRCLKLLSDVKIKDRVESVWQTISEDFERAYEALPAKYMERAEISFHPFVKLLGYFCIATKKMPGDVVEIGVWKGKSLAFMNALTPSNKKVIGIDPCYLPGQKEELNFFHQRLFPSCYLVRAPSEAAIDSVKQLSTRFAILHIDGNHLEEFVKNDFLNYERCVVPGGYIIFDDYGDDLYSPQVRTAVDSLRSSSMFEAYEIIGQLPGYENSYVLKKRRKFLSWLFD